MSTSTPIFFSHSRYMLRVRDCRATLDVLSFEGEEALSQPFRYSDWVLFCRDLPAAGSSGIETRF